MLNVLDFGAKCDGATDDSPAILAAVNAASARGMNGGNVVYFPPSKGCAINSPLNLPATDWRVKLYFDTVIKLNATLTIGSNYTLHGNTPGPKGWPNDDYTMVDVGYNFGPAIHILGTAIRLENLGIKYIRQSSDGILVEKSSSIVFKNVSVGMDGNNLTGIPLKIIGGFGYYFDNCGFATAWEATSPAIQLNDDPRLNSVGIFRMRDTFFGTRGIEINVKAGVTNSLSFENILFENARTPFLALNSTGGGGIWGIDLRGVNFADSQPPGFPIIRAKGIRLAKMSVLNCSTDFGFPMVDGDPVSQLNVN